MSTKLRRMLRQLGDQILTRHLNAVLRAKGIFLLGPNRLDRMVLTCARTLDTYRLPPRILALWRTRARRLRRGGRHV